MLFATKPGLSVTTSWFLAILVSLLLNGYCLCTLTTSSSPSEATIGDYAYSTDDNRVKDLVGLFETVKNYEESSYSEKDNVIISLSEAINKLRTLSSGYPLEFKCNKYVKLISRPDIRTYATVNLLMDENRLFNEIDQPDVNLVSRLSNERSFDPLGRIQTLIQSLDSERTDSHSNYSPSMQKELLDCINYYVYRHQRASLGVVKFAREAIESLKSSLPVPSESEITLKRLNESMETVKRLEEEEGGLEREQNAKRWLQELHRIHKLIMKNDFDIPRLVGKFLGDQRRINRVAEYGKISDRAEQLRKSCVELELAKQSDTTYSKDLMELNHLVELNRFILNPTIIKFIEDPDRQKVISKIKQDLAQMMATNTNMTATDITATDGQTDAKTESSGGSSLSLIDCDKNYNSLRNEPSNVLRSSGEAVLVAFATKVDVFKKQCLLQGVGAKRNRWGTRRIYDQLYTRMNRKLRENGLTQTGRESLINMLSILREFKI